MKRENKIKSTINNLDKKGDRDEIDKSRKEGEKREIIKRGYSED